MKSVKYNFDFITKDLLGAFPKIFIGCEGCIAPSLTLKNHPKISLC